MQINYYYVSLQTALYFHNMISQILNIIYAVSAARTKFYKTPIATVSIHHIHLYFGYVETGSAGLLKIATPEKALLDIFYLSQTKTRLFKTLQEIVSQLFIIFDTLFGKILKGIIIWKPRSIAFSINSFLV
jgi:hypothetical protein